MASVRVERGWDRRGDVWYCGWGDLEGVDGGLSAVVMELLHEVAGRLFSLFSPFDPRSDCHGFRVSPL